jgi:hypothetical protein
VRRHPRIARRPRQPAISKAIDVEVVVIVGLVALFFVPALLNRLWVHRRVLAVWEHAFKELRLEPLARRSPVSPPLVEGRDGDLHVVVERVRSGRFNWKTRVTVSNADFPPDLVLGPKSLATKVAKRAKSEYLLTGDAQFDSAVLVRGDPVATLSVLTGTTRPAVLSAVQGGLLVAEGRVLQEVGDALRTVAAVESAVQPVLDVARLLQVPANTRNRISTLARKDPVPGVRVRCLEVLAEHFPKDRRCRSAQRAALLDPIPRVRIAAANGLGEEGLKKLVALATDPGTDGYLASLAVSALGRRLPSKDASEVLDRALVRRQPGLARAAIKTLGQLGDDVAVTRLIGFLSCPDREVAALAARGLGSTKNEVAIASLLTALESEDSGLRVAAAKSLGRCAGVDVVAALHAAADRHPLDTGLRKAVATATGAIKTRAGDIAPGRLSLADGTSGAVSLSDNETGNVALTGEARKVESSGRSEQHAGPSRSAEIDHAAPRPPSRRKLRE